MAATPNEQGHETPIRLLWRGPLRVPELVARIGTALPELQTPHVYFSVQEYPEAEPPKLKIVYVGRAGNFLKRMFEHYRYFLGFGCWLRNEKGQGIYEVEPRAHLERLDHIDHSIIDAVQEVKRVSFFCASCQHHLNAVESALINHVMDRAESRRALGLQCDNSRREWHGWYDEILAIEHEAHRDFPESGKYLDTVFGTRMIRWGGNRDRKRPTE